MDAPSHHATKVGPRSVYSGTCCDRPPLKRPFRTGGLLWQVGFNGGADFEEPAGGTLCPLSHRGRPAVTNMARHTEGDNSPCRFPYTFPSPCFNLDWGFAFEHAMLSPRYNNISTKHARAGSVCGAFIIKKTCHAQLSGRTRDVSPALDQHRTRVVDAGPVLIQTGPREAGK